jgi:ElaB/YqjD/DUF883 family membrane-anchored ribosome-binding protein
MEHTAAEFNRAKGRMADDLKTIVNEVSQPVAETARQADEFVHASPWTAIGVAAVAGLLIGFLTARSRAA